MICAQSAFAQVLCVLLTVYWIILLARVILSWAMSLGWRRPYSGPLRTKVARVCWCGTRHVPRLALHYDARAGLRS